MISEMQTPCNGKCQVFPGMPQLAFRSGVAGARRGPQSRGRLCSSPGAGTALCPASRLARALVLRLPLSFLPGFLHLTEMTPLRGA